MIGEYGFSRGSYWIVLPSGIKHSTRMRLSRSQARERFRYMLRNELHLAGADAIIERIDETSPESLN